MKYRVDAKFVWYNHGTMIVLMYFLNNVPFTFDEVYKLGPQSYMNEYDIECMKLADMEKRYEVDDVYRGASYLISEMAHPCFNEIDIENPDILPDDICGSNHDIIDYY